MHEPCENGEGLVGEGLVRAGRILCRESVYFLPDTIRVVAKCKLAS